VASPKLDWHNPIGSIRNQHKLGIVGNYVPDRQISMIAYEELLTCLLRGFNALNVVSIRPKVFAGRPFKRPPKLASYIDRFIISPLLLPAVTTAIIVDQNYAYYALMLSAERIIVVCHDMIPWLYDRGDLQGWCPSRRLRLLLNANLKGLQRADHIICVSETTRRDLARIAGIPPDKTSTILNCERDHLPQVDEMQSRAILKSAVPDLAGSFMLTFAGSAYKNVRGSMRAFARLSARRDPPVDLVVIGGGADEIGRYAAQLGIRQRLHCLSDVSNDLLAALYRSGSVLMFPSLYEGFGWPVIEAQRFDLPVIAGDRGAVPEIAGGGALLVNPEDDNALCSAVDRVLSDRSLRESLQQRGAMNLSRFTYVRWQAGFKSTLESLGVLPHPMFGTPL
jgi:glycosyltransferase involved in cell wall biosynthesis